MIKDIVIATIALIVTYFGFIHNIEVLQVLMGIFYGIAAIVLPITLIFLYGDFLEAHKFRKNLSDKFTIYNLIISIIVISTTCYIFYTSQSYNFLAVYIILCILSWLVRIKTRATVISRA